MARSLNPRRNMSRLRQFAKQHLGVVMGDEMSSGDYVVRSKDLELLDKYYESTQYDDLMDWNEACALSQQDYVPVRQRKPRVVYNAARLVCDKVVAKLCGEKMFPSFVVEDDDDTTAFLRTVLKATRMRMKLIEPLKRMCAAGAVFVRYYVVNGSVQIEHALSKYCYPVFDGAGELDSIVIKYVYDDEQERDAQGNPKKKWYKIELTKMEDILSDNPEYKPGVKPSFNEVARASHGLGWVQGEWFVNGDDKFNHDGYGIYSDCLGFIDSLNYSLSQSDQAVAYNQEPQLAFNKMDEEELDTLVRSAEKAWNLGREGEAKYVQSDMLGVESAQKVREESRNRMFEIIRVVIQDPEKDAGKGAQSGEALKQLNAPLCELVDELRAMVEPTMIKLLIKIGLTCLHFNALGEDTIIEAPPGWQPTSLDVTAQWPPIFPPTLDDLTKAATAAASLSQGNIISRESLTRWIAQMIPSVDNIEEELKKIETQEPLPSPFGTFDQGGGGM